MSSLNRAYRIVPDRDLKLRKWAIMGFSIISSVGLIRSLWAPNVSLIMPFLCAIYILITSYILILLKCTLYTDFIALINVLNYLFKVNHVGNKVVCKLLKILPRRCLQRSWRLPFPLNYDLKWIWQYLIIMDSTI